MVRKVSRMSAPPAFQVPDLQKQMRNPETGTWNPDWDSIQRRAFIGTAIKSSPNVMAILDWGHGVAR